MKNKYNSSQNALEFRRLRAIELYEQGWKPVRIAEALGVTRSAVSQWLKLYREKGIEALRYKKVTKKPTRLSEEQKSELLTMLRQGAEAFGYRGHVWTQARVGELIQRKFGVSYHPNHVGKVLKACNWTCQKPVLRASQRNDDAVRQWCTERWPELKKKPKKKVKP